MCCQARAPTRREILLQQKGLRSRLKEFGRGEKKSVSLAEGPSFRYTSRTSRLIGNGMYVAVGQVFSCSPEVMTRGETKYLFKVVNCDCGGCALLRYL